MRVLVCQTPRLTYIQTIELLQQELATTVVDLAIFPEMAIEHPVQLTDQGALTMDNVALMMISKWIGQRRIYLVLGSVEEHDANGVLYDTCLVLGRSGEILLKYRKQSKGGELGMFPTEFGPVGVLLGAEIEDFDRWKPILDRRPCLVVNPTRSMQTTDPVLVRTRPDLLVGAWHRSFTYVEQTVEAKMQNACCSFVRADAPLHDGGTGSSIVVEPHRSVLAPCWGQATLVVETLQPTELQSRKLPGWRPLSIDDLVRAAMRDSNVLTHESLERGLRYHLWSMRPHAMALPRGVKWGQQSYTGRPRGDDSARSRNAGQRNETTLDALVTTLTSGDGRPMHAVATSSGTVVLWDMKLKCEACSLELMRSTPTAICRGRLPTQFVLAASTEHGYDLRVFDGLDVVASASVSIEDLPWDHWRVVESRHCGVSSKDDEMQTLARRPPTIRALHQIDSSHLFLVFEVKFGENVPQGVMYSFRNASLTPVDIYGDGPPPTEEDDEADEDQSEDERNELKDGLERKSSISSTGNDNRQPLAAPIPAGYSADRLIATHIADVGASNDHGANASKVLVCLFASNRLCHLNFDTLQLTELTLLEDTARALQRRDEPVSCTALRGDGGSSFHLVVMYKSSTLRWWHVCRGQRRLQAQTVTTKAVCMAALEWPLPPEERAQRTADRGSVATLDSSSCPPASVSIPSRSSKPRMSATRRSSNMILSSPRSPSTAGTFKRPSITGTFHRSSICNGVTRRRETVTMLLSHKESSRAAASRVDCTQPMRIDHTSIMVVAVEPSGSLIFYSGRSSRILRAHTCEEVCCNKAFKPDAVLVSPNGVTVLARDGELRFFEFIYGDKIMSITDIPIPLP